MAAAVVAGVVGVCLWICEGDGALRRVGGLESVYASISGLFSKQSCAKESEARRRCGSGSEKPGERTRGKSQLISELANGEREV